MKIIPQTLSIQITSYEEIIPSFQKMIEEVHQFQSKKFITGQFYQDLLTAYSEGVANAIRHANQLDLAHQVHCDFIINSDALELRVFDNGNGFDIHSIAPPDFKSYAESGRGVFMMRQLMDEVDYQKLSSGENVLILKREFIGTDAASRDLDLLYEISSAIIETTDLESVYNIILDRAVKAFQVERASILMYDEKLKRLKVVASRGLNPNVKESTQIRPGEGISGYVFQHAKPCLIQDMRENQSGWSEKKNYKSRSFISAPMICSPMRLGQQSVGVINMTDRADGKSFSKRDLKLLTTISNQAAAYLHICNLVAQSKEAEGIKRELNIAEQIQRSYLPSKNPKFPGFKIDAWLQTAHQVGGDFYDFLVKDKSLYIAMADVSGHNIGAALTVANFRSQLRAFLQTQSDPAEILNQLNKSMFGDLILHDQFISMVLLKLNQGSSELVFANAGHQSPILIRDENLIEISDLNKTGTVIGSLENQTYENQTYKMDEGDTLFLYTDGVTDLTNPQGERFLKNNLEKFLLKNAFLNPDQFMKLFQSHLSDYQDGTEANDDMTALFIRVE